MFPLVSTIVNEHVSTIWPVQSFEISDHKSPGPARLLFDRANAEFGLIYETGPGMNVVAQFPDTEDPIYFQVFKVRAACTRFNNTCKKVCVLTQNFQLDLYFTTNTHASEFLQKLARTATKVGNLHFEVHEAATNAVIARAGFNMEKEGYANHIHQQWMAIPYENTSEWARIYKNAKCSDFTVIAGGRWFPVHRVLLCTRSQYFNAVCDGQFSETERRSITLPESEQTVSTMLQEIYEVYNSTTGSIFTNFALRREMEKERIMTDLLALFVASDKYNLETIKQKAAQAIIDRMSFIHDPLNIVELAASICDANFPLIDRGLRKAIIAHLQVRLPTIMDDEAAWQEYSENKLVLKALHTHQCEMLDGSALGMLTPPVSPSKK